MRIMESLEAREEEVAREWQWLNDALNEVAWVRAERGDAAALSDAAASHGGRAAPHRAPHEGG